MWIRSFEFPECFHVFFLCILTLLFRLWFRLWCPILVSNQCESKSFIPIFWTLSYFLFLYTNTFVYVMVSHFGLQNWSDYSVLLEHHHVVLQATWKPHIRWWEPILIYEGEVPRNTIWRCPEAIHDFTSNLDLYRRTW